MLPLDATGGERRRPERALEEVRLEGFLREGRLHHKPSGVRSQLTSPQRLHSEASPCSPPAAVVVGSVNPPVKRCVKRPRRDPPAESRRARRSSFHLRHHKQSLQRRADFFKLIFVHIWRAARSSIMQEWSHRPLLLRNRGQRRRFRSAAVGTEWDGRRRETSRDVTCEFYQAEEEILFCS